MRRAAVWLAAALLAAAVCPAAAEKTESDETPAAVSTEAAAEKTEAPEKTAVDISDKCMYNGYQGGPKHKLNDGVYNNVYETGMRNGARAVEITVTDGEPMGAVYIQWAKDPLPVAVEVPTDDGGWKVIATGDGDFFADYIPVPENRHCRIVCSYDPTTKLEISEMRVLTAGTPGPEIQVWQKPEGKVDLMLIAGHPDDDLLWFGGALPYYAGELKKDTLVVCCAMSRDLRRLELCDALWACGVRIHPIYLHLRDFSDTDPKKFIQSWGGEERLNEMFTELYRRYKPDVVLLQDVNGEYGHGIHRAASLFGRQCVEMAADPGLFPDSAARFGTWEVPKVYVHLWEENQIRMDWKQPLEAFGGKTALEAAQDALQYHKSQVVHGWAVQDGGDLDNALFGLWHTTVGPDIEKNDFFEHIPSAKE